MTRRARGLIETERQNGPTSLSAMILASEVRNIAFSEIKRVGLSMCTLLMLALVGCGGPTKAPQGREVGAVSPGGNEDSSGTSTPAPANPEAAPAIIAAASLTDGSIPTSGGIPADALCWSEDGSSYLRQTGSGQAKQITLLVNGVQRWQRSGAMRAHCAPDLDWIVMDESYLIQVVKRDGQERLSWKPPVQTWVKGVQVIANGQALLVDLGQVQRKGFSLPVWVDLTTEQPTITQLPEAVSLKAVLGGKIVAYGDPNEIRFHDGHRVLDALTYSGARASVEGLSRDGASVLILDRTTQQVVYRRLTDGKGWSAPAPTDWGRAMLARDGSAVWILYQASGGEQSIRLVMMDAEGKVRAERRLDAKLDPVLRDVTVDGQAAVVQVHTAGGDRTCLISPDGAQPICYPIFDLSPTGTWALAGADGSQKWYPVSKVQ